MNAHILDRRIDGGSRCYLCRISLGDYVRSLPDTYRDYSIQREIVSNIYLDGLINTVLDRRHIPPIVLVVDKGNYREVNGNLVIKDFKILDGLQRTFRLKAIGDTIDLFNEQVAQDRQVGTLNKYKLSRAFSKQLNAINSSTDILFAIIRKSSQTNHSPVSDNLSENYQWFEVWTDLSPAEEVQKMLILNAGHKPVKIRHQIELLFLNILPDLKNGLSESFVLLREKDVSATAFSRHRSTGEFHFAHLITSLLSLSERKPVITTTSLVQGIQSSDSGIEQYGAYTNFDFLKRFVDFLVELDSELYRQYGEVGALWLGREVVLAGIFGAIGAVSGENKIKPEVEMSRLLTIIKRHRGLLQLKQFEDERNHMDLSKVNIGIVNRRAVFRAMRQLLDSHQSDPINWHHYFGGDE